MTKKEDVPERNVCVEIANRVMGVCQVKQGLDLHVEMAGRCQGPRVGAMVIQHETIKYSRQIFSAPLPKFAGVMRPDGVERSIPVVKHRPRVTLSDENEVETRSCGGQRNLRKNLDYNLAI